jgi:hypothetical protein
MKDTKDSPSILQDLGTVAGLYCRNVAWMLTQRVQRGPDWQQKLFDEAVRRNEVAERRPRETALRR